MLVQDISFLKNLQDLMTNAAQCYWTARTSRYILVEAYIHVGSQVMTNLHSKKMSYHMCPCVVMLTSMDQVRSESERTRLLLFELQHLLHVSTNKWRGDHISP